jgi:3',5'-cyclic AMP phosphodiesterase CpdA
MTAEPANGAPPASVVIAHLSDLEFGAHAPEAVESLVADVAAARPALTVVTGDLTVRSRAGQFAQARALLDRLPEPRLVLIGNHDLPPTPRARLLSPYKRFQARIEPVLDPVVRSATLWAVGLNSMPRWRWKDGRVSRRQAAAALGILGTAPPSAVRLLALHHPPFGHGRIRLFGRAGLVRALVGARVDLVLAGHMHLPDARPVPLADGRAAHRVVQVVAGTATSRRTRGIGRSWMLIRVDEDAIVVEERHESGPAWTTARTARLPRRG